MNNRQILHCIAFSLGPIEKPNVMQDLLIDLPV